MSFSRIHMMITYLLIVSIPFAVSITFNLTNIGPQNLNSEIVVNGSYVSNGGIQVTPNEIGSVRKDKAGRAIYFRQLRLWDKSTGESASFATNFTFVIDSFGEVKNYGDGLAFFLAENNSVISKGGALGLPVDLSRPYNATKRFVAVEFDTFYDDKWDPSDADHVGISISSLTSVRTQNWLSNVTGGGECKAWITYDSVSKNLSVSFTGYRNNTEVRQDGLFYTVDLRNKLPEWVIFGFSAATGDNFQRNNVISWSFNSSDLQNVDPVNRKNRKVGLVIGLAVGIAFTGLFLFVLWRWKKKDREDEAEDVGFDVEMNKEFEMGTGPKRFSYNELARSTSYFSESEKLGEGGFGGVYRGFLKDLSTYVAVKRVSKSSKQGIKEYASEVRIISRLRHRNLVQLIGWCHEKSELLLVYEYMENGSLDSHLFKAKSLFPWDTRYKIAHGLASALLYLHEEWEQCVLHRDIKPSNVMLDSNFSAKLGDFGLAKLVDHEKGSQTTMLAGTLGYMAPECVVTGKASKESDVYSFGVVILEIACGRKSIESIEYKAQEKQIRLLEWVWELYGTGNLLKAIDPRLGTDFEEGEIRRMMILGLWCAHPDSKLRPSMRQVIPVLNAEASLPILPSTMPVASYLAPSIVQNKSSSSSSNMDLSKQKTISTPSSYLDGR